jgi:hypothetical protein
VEGIHYKGFISETPLRLTSPYFFGTDFITIHIRNPQSQTEKDVTGKQLHLLRLSLISFVGIPEILIPHLPLVLTSPVSPKISFTNLSHGYPILKNMKV